MKRLLIGQLYDHAANMNRERYGTAEIAEFSAGLQTRQEERCDFAFLTSSRGKFYEVFMTIALAIPPLTVKK